MRILLIDNTSFYIKKLAGLFGTHKLDIIPYGSVGLQSADSYDLIVLSGGSAHSLIGNEDKFKTQIKLVSQTQKPVIGICFGFELLAYIYGAEILKLKQKVRGFQPVDVIDPELKSNVGSCILVYESHSWQVTQCSNILIPLITSPTGIEAFKHIHKSHYGVQFHPEITSESNEGKQVFDFIISDILSHNGHYLYR